MKKSLLLLCGTMLLGGVALGQEKSEKKKSDKDKVKIKVEKSVNGKKEVFEKEIDATGMSESEKQDMIEHIQDSLGVGAGKSGKFRIMIDEDDFSYNENRVESNDDFTFERKPQVRVYKRRPSGSQGFNDFEFDMERFSDRMKDVYTAIPRKIEVWDGQIQNSMGSSSTIRSLDVYPNRPDTETLNIRFFAPKEGDIKITVLNLAGDIISKSEVKAFKGEYVGQVKLKSANPGVYFVIVAQGEDGISRKVSL